MQMTSSTLLFFALCVAAGSLVASVENHFPHAVEPASGVQFPLEMPGEESTLSLAGSAIRVKKVVFVNVQVYAVGLYVNAPKLAAAIGKTIDAADAGLYKKLLAGDSVIPMAIRLTMVRTVGGDTMSGALKEAVEPRMKAVAASSGADVEGPLKAFTALFDMPNLETGTTLVFQWKAGGRLAAEIGGKHKGEVAAPALCEALFSVFLDESAVVERKDLIGRLAELVAAVPEPEPAQPAAAPEPEA